MGIVIIFTELRQTQTAVTHANDDGSYTILVNINKCREKQIKGIVHELNHINHNDFSKDLHAGLLERLVHMDHLLPDVAEINFFPRFFRS